MHKRISKGTCPECGSHDRRYSSRTHTCSCHNPACGAVYPVALVIQKDYTIPETIAANPLPHIPDNWIVEVLSKTPMRLSDASRYWKVSRYQMSKKLKKLVAEGKLKVKADMMTDGVSPDMRSKLFGVW
jgi:hypothetical protein